MELKKTTSRRGAILGAAAAAAATPALAQTGPTKKVHRKGAKPAKTPLFNLEERVAIMRQEVAGLSGPGKATIEVKSFQGLLMEFAGDVGAQMVVRGLRAVSDFEYEFQMVGMNHAMKSDVETVFLMADPQHQAIASRLVKEIAVLGGDVSPFVSAHVAGLLQQRAKDLGVKK